MKKPKSGGLSRHRAEATEQLAVPSDGAAPTFPIVGIGASAGGLEALEKFLAHVPADSDLAVIIVQHLAPNHKGMLPELLQRATPMPVCRIEDQMRVEPRHVYVIPPNHDISLLHGVLYLLEPAKTGVVRLPIDFFFRSLADDLQQGSIGVILSGMGTDGTLGLRAIKEKAGAAFVQTPASARCDGMPRSAIDVGLADVVAPVEELPGRIVAYLQHLPLLAAENFEDRLHSEEMGQVIVLLRNQTGHDFSQYKLTTLQRRVARRLGLHQLKSVAEYVRYLRANPQESELLFKELLIGVTSFFRDPAVWEQLGDVVFPELFAACADNAALRAWVPACSTGEEAYSLAITFHEALARCSPARNISLQIFATDLDDDAIDLARAAAYPANITADVSAERLERYFVETDHGYRVGKDARSLVIFAQQNLASDPPFSRLDLLSCRNLLIYLESELQHKLLSLFHYCLKPNGFLVLGSAESVGTAGELFTPLPGKTRIFRHSSPPVAKRLADFPTVFTSARHDFSGATTMPSKPTPAGLDLKSLADGLLPPYMPAAVIVTEKGDIVYVSGKTGNYLEPAAGKANWNLFAMARGWLASPLLEGFREATTEKRIVKLRRISLADEHGQQFADVTIQPITNTDRHRGMVLVVFTEAPPPVSTFTELEPNAGVGSELNTLRDELARARGEVQVTREAMQNAMEDLNSINEELQSTNEELQSANEELTTSKEEMQSMNEELQTVNQELQSKLDELSRANNDMKNLLNSTEIATLFLDGKLHLQRFTSQTARVFRLLPGDVGRPIGDITTDLDYPDMADDARAVMQTLAFREKSVTTKDGRWYRVRIMPYVTHENRIDGVVITFMEITAAKQLELELRTTEAQLRNLLAAQQPGQASK